MMGGVWRGVSHWRRGRRLDLFREYERERFNGDSQGFNDVHCLIFRVRMESI
jgi:hypothetical protein